MPSPVNMIESKYSCPPLIYSVGFFFGNGPTRFGEGRDHRVRAVGIGRQETAAMRGADLEAREAVERPFEDQMRQGDGGFERVADRVR